MNKKALIIGGVFAFIVIVGMVYFISNSGGDPSASEKPQFVSDKWNENYVLDDKNPCGTILFKELMESKADSALVITDSLCHLRSDTLSTFVFVGDKFSLHPDEFDSLIRQVENGNDLFLSFHEMTDNINEFFFYDIYNFWNFDDDVVVFTGKDSFNLSFVHQTDTIARIWKLFDYDNLIDSTYDTLSYFMETPNFIRMDLGKGNVFLHFNPEMLVNYQLLEKQGFNHASFVAEQVLQPKQNRRIKWLELGRLTYTDSDFTSDEPSPMEGKEDESLLQFIFEKRELLIAFLLVILGFMLYFFFRSKRYWPVVPFVEKQKNRALEFAETMQSIYWNQNSPYSILLVMRKNFHTMIQKQFFIDLSKEGEQSIQLLAEKSGFDRTKLTELVDLLQNPKMRAVDEEYIQKVALLQRTFYLHTGIIKYNVQQKTARKKIVFERQIAIASLLMFLGILGILRGFYSLSLSDGFGILFWPAGIVVLTLGIILFNRKVLLVENRQLIFYPYFYGKKVVDLSDLMTVENRGNKTIFQFTGNRKVEINRFEIASSSRDDFQHWINQLKK